MHVLKILKWSLTKGFENFHSMLQNQSPEVEFALAVLTTCEDQPAVEKRAPTEAKAIIFTEQVIYH